MDERRYTEDEIVEIFERAAEEDASSSAVARHPEGRTLAEIQAIGREAGFSAEVVERAARSLDHTGDSGVRRRFLGLPLAVGRTVELDRALTDDEWHQLVADLRTTFDAKGRVREEGAFRQWTNGNLQALLEPTPTGHRLRLRTRKGQASELMMGGLAMMGLALALVLVFVLTGEPSGEWIAPLFLFLAGAGMFGTGAAQLPSWASTRLDQMEDVVARLTRGAQTES